MIALIDNYDSFTYNIVQYLQELGSEVAVFEANDIGNLDEFSHIIISPGAGKPSQAQGSLGVIGKYARVKPILGICLGHQCIAHFFGGKVRKGTEPIHGKTSKLRFMQDMLFEGCEQGFEVMRYHSLCVSDVGEELEAIAWSEDGVIMALRHKRLPIYGLQYHPESILSSNGKRVLSNFLESQPSLGGGGKGWLLLEKPRRSKNPCRFYFKRRPQGKNKTNR